MADSPFLKPLAGYRTIIPRAGETLQQLALRELGDASRWRLLAWVNGLKAPFIAQTAADVAPGVVMFGTPLLVPSNSPEPSAGSDDLYYTDVRLSAGLPVIVDGDWQLVSGVDNLEQGLRHRIVVDRRELLFHPTYGCFINAILGNGNTPQNLRLAAFYVRSSLLEDERVRTVESVLVSASGDAMLVEAKVIAVSGVTVDLGVTL